MSDSSPVIRALARNVPLAPQKGRQVADQIRGMAVGRAMELLQFSRRQKAGALIRKNLSSAVANAEDRSHDIDALYVRRIEVSAGMTMKRARFGARGRVSRINHRRSHILIELAVADGEKN